MRGYMHVYYSALKLFRDSRCNWGINMMKEIVFIHFYIQLPEFYFQVLSHNASQVILNIDQCRL